MTRILQAAALAILTALPAGADPAQIVDVVVREQSRNVFRFDVTIRHPDTGWQHYANEWQVRAPRGGQVFGTRVLLHPHATEQPFTRSLGSVQIPPEVTEVEIRARCLVDGWSRQVVTLTLPRDG